MQNSKNAVMFCLSGLDTRQFIQRAGSHVPLSRPLVLLYVIDTRPAEELGYIARRLQARSGVTDHGEELMASADEQAAHAVLDEAEAACRTLGFAGGIAREVRRGRPEQEIVHLLAQRESAVGLVVIGSSYKQGPHPLTGPASVGHVARFVVDHSPCDVLVLR